MISLSASEMQNIEYEILCEFDKVCRKSNYRYTLAGGSLLGAVRHQGFIPWDDDIDVAMPREDYNKFLETYNNESSHYKLINIYNNENYGFLHARLYDDRTIMIEDVVNRKNAQYGVFIDIFPVDNLGSTYQEALNSFNKNKILKNILIASNWSKYSFSKTRSIIYEPIRLVFYLISRFYDPNKLAKKLDSSFQSAGGGDNYKGIYCGLYKQKEIFGKDIYDNLITLKFENNMFSCLTNYDKYLRQFFGNYMQLPSIDKRNSHHTFKVYVK